jgi:hypothetical protein
MHANSKDARVHLAALLTCKTVCRVQQARCKQQETVSQAQLSIGVTQTQVKEGLAGQALGSARRQACRAPLAAQQVWSLGCRGLCK